MHSGFNIPHISKNKKNTQILSIYATHHLGVSPVKVTSSWKTVLTSVSAISKSFKSRFLVYAFILITYEIT